MGEGLLFGLSWLDGSVSSVLSERKVIKVSLVLRCLSNHVEVNIFLLVSVLVPFLFSSGLIRLLDFLIYSVITVSTVFFVVKILSSFLFVLRYFVSGVCLSIYVFVFCHPKLGVLGPWEFLWRAGSYIFCVCDSAVWSAGPVQFYLALSWSGWRDCTDFPCFLAL
jgi:hypothetical protein